MVCSDTTILSVVVYTCLLNVVIYQIKVTMFVLTAWLADGDEV